MGPLLNPLEILAAHRGYISTGIYRLSYKLEQQNRLLHTAVSLTLIFLLTRQKNLLLGPTACWQLIPRLAVAWQQSSMLSPKSGRAIAKSRLITKWDKYLKALYLLRILGEHPNMNDSY